jgi:peptide/nickel transport system substrate-binding protein
VTHSKTKLTFASVIGLLAMLVAACGSSSTTGGKPPATTGYDFTYNYKAPAAKTGKIIISDWQFPDNLNPLATTSSVSVEVYQAIWNSCLVQLPDLTLGVNGYKPDQCSEVPSVANGDESADGKSTTLKLDPKATWSDGTPITGQDFCFFVDLATDGNVYGAPPYDQVQDCKATQSSFTIDWTNAYGSFLSAVAGIQPFPLHVYADKFGGATYKYDTNAAQALISQDNFLTAFPADNGAYTIQSFKADDSIVLVKNPKFYSGFFKGPSADQIIFKGTGDKDVLIQSYKSGEIDKAEDFTIADLPKFADIPPAEVAAAPQIFFEHLEFNQRPDGIAAMANGGVSPFADAKVRQGFVQGWNRCAAIQAVLGVANCDDPSLRTNEITAPPGVDFDASVPDPKFDAKAAAALLDSAGYKLVGGKRTLLDGKTPFAVTLASTKGNLVRNSFMNLMAQQWNASLGVTVNIVTVPAGTLFGLFNKSGTLATSQYDISLFAFQSPSDPQGGLDNTVTSSSIPSATNAGGQNYAGVKDQHVDDLLNQTRTELDLSKRIPAWKDLQKYMASQYFFEPLYIRANYSLHKPTLGNYLANPTATSNDWDMEDWFTTKSS